MPWCPNCKTEFRKGFTVCSDCNIPLADKEEYIPFFQAEEKSIAENLIQHFKESGLRSEIQYDEGNLVYVVSIPSEKQREAKKLYQAFYFAEREKAEKEAFQESAATSETNVHTNFDSMDDITHNKEDLLQSKQHKQEAARNRINIPKKDTDMDKTNEIDPILSEDKLKATEHTDSNHLESNEEIHDNDINREDINIEDIDTEDIDPDSLNDEDEMLEEDLSANILRKGSTTYVLKSEQYKDLSATVGIFFFFGFAGIIVLILNTIGVLNLINGLFPTIVMGALFLFFLYVGISTHRKAKIVKAEIEEENKLTEKINQWLNTNVTETYLSSIQDDNVSREVNYIQITDTIRDQLINEFGPQNESYLDRLIEDFYTNNFEKDNL